MLDFWLFPALIVLVVLLLIFYLRMRRLGGSGARTDGRTVLDTPEAPPPGEIEETGD